MPFCGTFNKIVDFFLIEFVLVFFYLQEMFCILWIRNLCPLYVLQNISKTEGIYVLPIIVFYQFIQY